MRTTRSAHSTSSIAEEAARELVASLDKEGGEDPRLVVFFASVSHDGEILGRALEARYPAAAVIGCSSNGEFCDHGYGKGGAVALAIGGDRIGACAAALADVGGDVEAGIRDAAARLESKLGRDLRSLDVDRYAALALLEGARGREERINEALGNVAPFLPFVGGSAGDDITFSGTWTFAEGRAHRDGTVLLVAEMLVPFRALMTCNFVATDRAVTVTRCDPERRLILELDGEPAAPYFAKLIGTTASELNFAKLHANPLGLMIDGEPWLRSCVRTEGDALFFACAVVEGARLSIMKQTPFVEGARAKLEAARAELGGALGGAIFFNCAYRMVEAQITGREAEYHAMLSSMVPHAGIHSNGESYLGHINQTLTGLIFG